MIDFIKLKFELLEAMADLDFAEQQGHGGDAQVERLLAAEDDLLALPDDSLSGVVLRSYIHLRRMTVAADEDEARPLGAITDALDRSGLLIEEASVAFPALIAIAEQHRAAILASNCDHAPNGASAHSTLAPDREVEMLSIESSITHAQRILASLDPAAFSPPAQRRCA